MIKLMMVISILAGLYLGFHSAQIGNAFKLVDKKIEKECSDTPDKREVFETEKEKRCVSRFKSVSDSYVVKGVDFTSKTRGLFMTDLKAQNVRPEEYNIYIEKSSDGKVRRYNPRLDIFARLQVRSYVTDNGPIANFSIIDDQSSGIQEVMEKRRCLSPKLSKLKKLGGISFFDEFNSAKYQMIGTEGKKKVERENFSAFSELQKKESWYMFFVGSQNYIENYLLANTCNNSIALVLNHCVLNPKYDMQLEEAFWFKGKGRIGINIYCKSSSDKEWTYQTSKYLAKK